MTASELAKKLNAAPVIEPEPDREVIGGYTGDLLSRVMGRAEADCAWVTIMNNINVIAVASLKDVSAVMLAEGVTIEEDVIAAAEEHEINVYTSEKPAFELCCEIQKLL